MDASTINIIVIDGKLIEYDAHTGHIYTPEEIGDLFGAGVVHKKVYVNRLETNIFIGQGRKNKWQI